MATAQFSRHAPPAGATCSRRTTRCLNARDYAYELNDCCRSHVIEIVRDLSELLVGTRAKWWADYGTLLGAVRNPMTAWADFPWLKQDGRDTPGPHAGIVPHDKDADLGVLWDDWSRIRALRVPLERKGYSVYMNGSRGIVKVFFSRDNHANVDLFFWRLRKDGKLFRNGYAQVDQFKGREFDSSFLEDMGTVTWEGLRLPAPARPEEFLQMRYGPSWRTPVMANHDGVRR